MGAGGPRGSVSVFSCLFTITLLHTQYRAWNIGAALEIPGDIGAKPDHFPPLLTEDNEIRSQVLYLETIETTIRANIGV